METNKQNEIITTYHCSMGNIEAVMSIGDYPP